MNICPLNYRSAGASASEGLVLYAIHLAIKLPSSKGDLEKKNMKECHYIAQVLQDQTEDNHPTKQIFLYLNFFVHIWGLFIL